MKPGFLNERDSDTAAEPVFFKMLHSQVMPASCFSFPVWTPSCLNIAMTHLVMSVLRFSVGLFGPKASSKHLYGVFGPNICAEAQSRMHTCVHKHLHTCKHGFWTWTKWLTWRQDVTDYQSVVFPQWVTYLDCSDSDLRSWFLRGMLVM